jgi:hypothetical protein
MQVRRALIAFVVVFAVVTLIAVASGPRETDDSPATPAPAQRSAAAQTVTLSFRHPVEAGLPVRQLRRGSRAVIRVETGVAGDVEIPALGLIQPAAPGTPAVFDVLAVRAGRFDVSLLSVAGERTKLGTLAVND